MTKRIHAVSDDALGTLDATGVAEAIQSKHVSVQEVTEAAIARAEKVNGQLDAIVIKAYDDARQQKLMGTSGLFYGVPTFIKDNDHIAGYPTQLGTGVFKAKPAKKNSKYVNQMLSSGLNIIGKTTMPEFGLLCSTENERWNITRNPWNTDYTPGGSSSGSAAMVASGVVPIAQANDGAGSTRIPAACCGLVGLKPTRNRLMPMDGTELLPINIAYQGVLTRTVRDTAAFYAAAEQFYKNPKLPEMGHVKDPIKRRLKFAYIKNHEPGQAGHIDADTYRVMMETVKLLESLGHTTEEIDIPVSVEEMMAHYLNYYGFLSYMMTSMGRFVVQAKVNTRDLEPFTHGLSATFKKNLLNLPGSIRILGNKMKEIENDMASKYDVILTPVTTLRTPEIGYFSPKLSAEEVVKRASYYAPFPGMQNVSGAPSLSIPMGIDSNDNPLGMMFSAPKGQDRLLLELALELEQAQPWKMIWES